ncbi:MAG TPA: oxidoreductase [Tianweitania sediminis]|nr:oxidoreductase [Tianweitania sediminis]
MADNPVWFITGCSTGFGRELAELIAKRGWNLVATTRDKSSLSDLAGDNVLLLDLDVTQQSQITEAVAAAEERFGRIDVLVNNAGYGYLTSVEEGEDEAIRAQFETNVFGLFALTRAVLPLMRKQRSGHIMNITSVAGFVGNPSSGYYAASKHAVEGFSKSLANEMRPLGIRVTCVAPGPFRTDWAGRSLQRTSTQIADYADTVGKRFADLDGYSGKQAGDPVRAGEAMITLSQMDKPPLHIVLGAGGHKVVSRYLLNTITELEAHRDLALGTDFPADG